MIGCCAALAAAACSAHQLVHQAGIPGTRTPAALHSVHERSDYLDAVLETAGTSYRFFFPRTPECTGLLVEGADLEYVNTGSLGRVRQEEQRCDPVGILSLAQWRDRGPRQIRRPVPRDQATFEEFYRDDEMILARGRFPLAGEIRWTGGLDTVGVIPNVEGCRAVAKRGVASMEFKAAGRDAFVLVGEKAPCPLLGFARPALD